jgi:hypothetical protein
MDNESNSSMDRQLSERAEAQTESTAIRAIPTRAARQLVDTSRVSKFIAADRSTPPHGSEEARVGVAPATSDSPWQRIENILRKHHHQPDTEAARILYSAVAAHRLEGVPVWPMLVAPPGSLKTELLNALEGLPGVHVIDNVTPQTFISGQSKNRVSRTTLHQVYAPHWAAESSSTPTLVRHSRCLQIAGTRFSLI